MMNPVRINSHPSMQQLPQIDSEGTDENFVPASQPLPTVQESYGGRAMNAPQQRDPLLNHIISGADYSLAVHTLGDLQASSNLLAAHAEQVGRMIALNRVNREFADENVGLPPLKRSLDEAVGLVSALTERFKTNLHLLVPNEMGATQDCRAVADRVKMLCDRLHTAHLNGQILFPEEVQRYLPTTDVYSIIKAVTVEGPILGREFFADDGIGGFNKAVHVDQTKNLSVGQMLCKVENRLYIVQL